MKASVARVLDALTRAGVQAEIVEFPQGTRTAQEAAAAVGAEVGQIVKSLVFLAGERPTLVFVSGANRADSAKLERAVGAAVQRADADAVRASTGFAIGGVPPVGHTTALPAYLDRDLLRYASVWAAAGTPNAVFSITPDELMRITGAQVVDVAVETPHP